MKKPLKYFDKILLILFFFSSAIWTGQSLYAQSDYYLDSIASLIIDFTSEIEVDGTKYYYNNDNKLAKIVRQLSTSTFSYNGNTTTERTGDQSFESTFDNDGQLLVRSHFDNNSINTIDSFFYENGDLKERRNYYAFDDLPYGTALWITKTYSHNSANLIENTVTIFISGSSGDTSSSITENYEYDLNLNLISWAKTTLELDTGESDEESKIYSYNEDQQLDTLWNFTNGLEKEFYSYTYSDNVVFRDGHMLDFNGNFLRTSRTHTHLSQNDYFEYDSLLIFDFQENGDSTLRNLRTNQENINSFDSDTLIRRHSQTIFDEFGLFIIQFVTKIYFVKNPEILGNLVNSLPTFAISPNPITRGSVLSISELDFDYDQVVIYSLDGRNTQFLNIDQYNRHFNAPQETGMYLVQLWNDKKAVTQVMKIVVQ